MSNSQSVTIEEIIDLFAPWNTKYARPSWRPVTSDSADGSSFFGGTPTHSLSAEWPCCQSCNEPLQFFIQLDMAALPQAFNAAASTGLVQLFCCTNDETVCGTWEAFNGTHAVRLVEHAQRVPVARPSSVIPFKRKTITNWEQFSDQPHPEEHELLGVTYEYDWGSNHVAIQCSEFSIDLKAISIDLECAEEISEAENGDKLGGWPFWVQHEEYPACPECQQKMELLFQIDSEDNVDYMFGDSGCSHITQCRTHPHILAFAWACY